ncbi:MAG: hypothetical protein FWH35_09675, partial [Treponema sp.]|nr:hypothetical protein [Treponema sp.]
KGTYKVADGEFRFTINKPNEFEQFRMILANYNAALQFSTSGEFFGFKQRIYGGDLGAWNNVVLEWLTPIEDWAKFVPFNPFTVNTITHDGNDRNVIVNVALDVGGAISADGLPDPKDAIEKGQILLGFSYDYYNLSSNQYEWNTLNFMPITIEPYKSNSTKTVNDMWRIILPPYYAYAPSNATKYLFITPDYKDKGTPALSFGNPYNILFTYEGNIQYEIYELSDTF